MSNYNAIGNKPITISIEANNLERMIEDNNNNPQEVKNHYRYDINDFKKQHLDVDHNKIVSISNPVDENPTNNLNGDNDIIKTTNENEIVQSIPWDVKLLYSLPAFGKMSCLLILSVHALIFYENLGSSLLLLSFFTALGRAVEIILKPIIAHISDTSNFKGGRRKPFMLFGCGFYALFLVLIFSPLSNMSNIGTSFWFGIHYVLFFVADTVTNIPYLALGPELSNDTKEREKLYIFFYISQYLGVLVASMGPVIIQKLINNCDCSGCDGIRDIQEKINCQNTCNGSCEIKSMETSLQMLSVFIGLLFVFSIIVLCNRIKEKKHVQKTEDENHIIPTLIRMVNNKPFIRLLIPWIIDVTITQIFATMLPFFISYIINPQKYCEKNKLNTGSEICSSNLWLAVTISGFFICCIVSMLMWHYIIKVIPRKKAWQGYSLISVFTFAMFMICGEGSMSLLVIFSILNAMPAGGAYLNDVFVSDIIDYDEFLTGKRNEGIYVVFSSFTPKIVTIFAQSLPLTIMSLLGFIPSSGGQTSEQPLAVLDFVRFYFIAIPVFLSLVSYYFKLKYPIDTDVKMTKLRMSIQKQNEKIAELCQNNDYFTIIDPVYNSEHINVIVKDKKQEFTKMIVEHFYSKKYLKQLYEGDYEGVKSSVVWVLISLSIVIIILLTILIVTFTYLENKNLSLIPLFTLIVITIVITFFTINIMRLRVIQKVMNNEYEIDKKYVFLSTFKLLKEEKEDTPFFGLADECTRLKDDCTS